MRTVLITKHDINDVFADIETLINEYSEGNPMRGIDHKYFNPKELFAAMAIYTALQFLITHNRSKELLLDLFPWHKYTIAEQYEILDNLRNKLKEKYDEN